MVLDIEQENLLVAGDVPLVGIRTHLRAFLGVGKLVLLILESGNHIQNFVRIKLDQLLADLLLIGVDFRAIQLRLIAPNILTLSLLLGKVFFH